MKKTIIAAGMVLALGTGFSLNAFAQAKPEVLVKQRQAAMTLFGKYWGPLGGMNAGKVPFNAKVIARNAGYLEVLSTMPWDGFNASTKGVKSAAMPVVWTDAAGFKAAQDKVQSEMAKLAAAGKGGDEAAIKKQLAEAAKTCGGCHKKFREKSK